MIHFVYSHPVGKREQIKEGWSISLLLLEWCVTPFTNDMAFHKVQFS